VSTNLITDWNNNLETPCPLCKGKKLFCISERDRKGKYLKTDLCIRCGHVFTNPKPNKKDLDLYYKKLYRKEYKGKLSPKTKHVFRSGISALERYRTINPLIKSEDRITDIGCGSGEFLDLLSKKGYNVVGIEPNQSYSSYAKNEYGVEVREESIERAVTSKDEWDIVTMHHVLEHLSDPIFFLRIIRETISDRGKLIIEVPNIEANFHSPKRLFHFAHLHSFCQESLEYATMSAGFKTLKINLKKNTKHLHIICESSNKINSMPDQFAGKRIQKHLKEYTVFKDLKTKRPYKRLLSKIYKPILEQIKIRKYISNGGNKKLLDSLYSDFTIS